MTYTQLVYDLELSATHNLQAYCKGWSDLMLYASQLGSPRQGFTLYFAVGYLMGAKPLACRVLWTAAVTEWTNLVLKWLLVGHRPYWWEGLQHGVRTEARPSPANNIQQFHLTCETGPGNPSGHVMVTSAVLFSLLSGFNLGTRKIHRLLWFAYLMFLMVMAVSRIFIAAHFPHQVLVGFLTGVLIAKLLEKLPTSRLQQPQLCMTVAVCMLVVAISLHAILQPVFGLDPDWSLHLAQRYCTSEGAVRIDTHPLSALSRDAGALLGLAVALTASHDTRNTLCNMAGAARRRKFHFAFMLVTFWCLDAISSDIAPVNFYIFVLFKSATMSFLGTADIKFLVDKIMSR